MQRPIFYPGGLWRGFDVANGYKDGVIEVGNTMRDALGLNNYPVIAGLYPSAPGDGTATVVIGAGGIWMNAPVDPTKAGSQGADQSPVYQRGTSLTGSSIVPIPLVALTGGQSIYYLICGQAVVKDQVRGGDPTGGLLSLWNEASPINPLTGLGGNQQVVPTMRYTGLNILVVDGAPAATGTEIVPDCPAGYVPICTAHATGAQTTFLAADIAQAPNSPQLQGLLRQHHTGAPGQAPQVDILTEVAAGHAIGVPGWQQLPSGMIVNFVKGTFAHGGGLQTAVACPLAKPVKTIITMGFAQDSGLAPQFQYGILSFAGVLDSVNMTCNKFFIDDGSGAITSRATLSGSCLGVGVVYGY